MPPSVQFAALADDTRCALIDLLRERPRPVHELAAAFSISRPAISRHLRLLKDAGLIAEERSGRQNIYSLKRQRLRVLSTWLEQHWSIKPSRSKGPAEATAPKVQSELDL